MSQKPIDPALHDVLLSWFNLDSVDMNDKEGLFDNAGAAAGDLARRYLQKHSSLEPLISDIETFVSVWGPDFTMQIINITSVDWLADDEYENALK